MLAAIDVGNTQIVVGLGAAEADTGWRTRWRLATRTGATADELTVVIEGLMAGQQLHPTDVSAVVLSSVVPGMTQQVVEATAQVFRSATCLRMVPGTRTGMEVRYEPPGALGSDRLADAIAARARFGAPVVAIDFGTATTFNVVGRDGAFVGGAIAPGIGLAAQALAEAGARLRTIDLAGGQTVPLVGRNTAQSMRAGTLYGYADLTAGLLARIDAELGTAPPVVATGGLAPVVAPLVERIGHIEPDLTLDGLRLVYRTNRGR
jgi:type III pantothenate kinase